ncbi:MAG TPA: hypothetical protein VFD82_06910 [Planctomycetota bacterium]|nr:hypothetical protein [Planctomycetota bacterium]
MSRPRSVLFALLCANLVPAQESQPAARAADAPAAADALAAAKQKLTTALQKTAALQDTGYRANWGADRKKKGESNPFEALVGASKGSVEGSWHTDRQHVAFDNDNKDELVVAGRRSIAKDDQRDWRLRPGRFADGSTTGFVPDVPLLLQQLANWDLAVLQRTAGALDDRPVEVISVTLNADQVGEAVWAGLIPESVASPLMMGAFGRFGAAGPRPAPATPDATVDLAVTIDPGTSLVHQIQFRGWSKQNAGGRAAGGGVFVVQAGGGAVAMRGGGDEEGEEEDTKAETGKAGAPMTFENGLPIRPRKKTTVMDYTVRLFDHGSKKAPELSDEQKKLLGRKPL